ncbi:outer membrane biogenesis protein BamB [Rubripirellula lacrimiformis]|uniref:Outer membrane biogenesis protein BamB n=1 Tax=Rubripirellula lacrimiformis TaxID=1930273 RepID=A0A517N6T5_9BACT|nr:PQQ-binding-like beta-propeller repeat protein [Rubripirellula lacrimiformis]QDT02835.1 outer membrane biogenesis protein BamB [Rubripirellula lacrimiformis]
MNLTFLSSIIRPVAIATIVIAGCLDWQSAHADGSWPQWRGSSQNGVAEGTDFPLEWNESDGIAWKTPLPGKGSSTPVVAGQTAYLTSGIEGQNVLMAIDTNSGQIQWQTEMGPDRGNKHKKGGGSNPSPVVDGDQIIAYFRSGDLGCVSSDGKIVWQVNLQDLYGEDTLWWDLGSSPMLTKSAVVVAVMQSGPSYLVAFDRNSGDELWKQDRMLGAPEEAAQSYSTPIAVTVGDKPAIAVLGADHLTLHSADDGHLLGKVGGFNPTNHKFFRSISSPAAEGKYIVCPYSRGETLTTVDAELVAAGRERDAVVWFRDDIGSDVPTPAIRDGRVYLVSDGKTTRGTVSCLDIQTGKTIWSTQVPKSRISFSSSPLVAGDHLYVTGEDGTTHVIGPLSSPEPKVVASNELDDDEPFTVASPVPLGQSLLIRTKSNLYRVGGK